MLALTLGTVMQVVPARADMIVMPFVGVLLGSQLANTAIWGTITVGSVVSAIVTTAIGPSLTIVNKRRGR
jgi:hypothetical protein